MNIIVCGASSGIGKLLSETLVNLNNNVIGTYNSNKVTSKEIDYIKCDISKERDIKRLYKYVINKYNNIDVLINCAALCLDNDVLNKTKKEFMKVLEVNLVGTFLMCKYFAMNVNKGVIINISSTDASTTYSTYSLDYAASKAGVENITKNLANRFPNIKICAVAPNFVDTDAILNMNPNYLKEEMKRVNQKELIKKEVVVNKIIDIITNNNIKSGDIVKVINNE